MSPTERNKKRARKAASRAVKSRSANVLPFPKKGWRDPLPEFPPSMLVAVDAWSGIDAFLSAEEAAHRLGGLLVDAGRFYRTIIKAGETCGVNMATARSAAAFLGRVSIKVRFEEETAMIPEAQVAVNDRWFLKNELTGVQEPKYGSETFMSLSVRLNKILATFDLPRRVVMLGREIGFSVFPETPYKFFFHTTQGLRDENAPENSTYPGVVRPTSNDPCCSVREWRGLKILMFDTARIHPSMPGALIVGECVLRAIEHKEYGARKRKR